MLQRVSFYVSAPAPSLDIPRCSGPSIPPVIPLNALADSSGVCSLDTIDRPESDRYTSHLSSTPCSSYRLQKFYHHACEDTDSPSEERLPGRPQSGAPFACPLHLADCCLLPWGVPHLDDKVTCFADVNINCEKCTVHGDMKRES